MEVQHHAKIYTRLTDTFVLSWLLLRGLIWTLSMHLSCSHCFMKKTKQVFGGGRKWQERGARNVHMYIGVWSRREWSVECLVVRSCSCGRRKALFLRVSWKLLGFVLQMALPTTVGDGQAGGGSDLLGLGGDEATWTSAHFHLWGKWNERLCILWQGKMCQRRESDPDLLRWAEATGQVCAQGRWGECSNVQKVSSYVKAKLGNNKKANYNWPERSAEKNQDWEEGLCDRGCARVLVFWFSQHQFLLSHQHSLPQVRKPVLERGFQSTRAEGTCRGMYWDWGRCGPSSWEPSDGGEEKRANLHVRGREKE